MGTVRSSVSKAKARRSASRPWVKFLKRALVVGSVLGLVGMGTGIAFLEYSIKAAEPLVDKIGEKIKEYNSKPSRIYSSDGKLLYEIKPIYRESVSLSDLPEYVKNAILAAEDKRFYEHNGVDMMGLGRAVFNFTKHGGEANGGGSTITMQLAKKLFSASEMTIQRKVQDISIAFNLEKRYTKDQILELYINQIYYGEQAYGLNAAAEIYFNKEAKDLDIAEAAMIARCIRLPSTQNPVRNYQIADSNKIVVLDTMLAQGWITQSEYDKAKAEKPKVRGFSKQKFSKTYAAPYFVAAVKRDLDRLKINISEGGYTITTTLDSSIQQNAEDSTESVIRRESANVGAFICMDSEGRILADVGGRDFAKNQYSYTTQSPLQPGSSFKSFIYAEALKNGLINENSELDNSTIRIKEGRNKYYVPKDHHAAGGTVDFWRAYTQSWNLPAIHTLLNMGLGPATKAIKEDFGFDSEIRAVPSAALGSNEVKAIEMLEAYSVFPLDGKRVQPYRIKEIVNANGEVVYQGKMEYVNTSISPSVCEVMDKVMRGVVTSGTGREADACPDAHGKTGTTNDGKSLWFCGYSKGIIGIALAGNQHYDRKRKKWLLGPIEQFGGDVAAPIWAESMKAAVAKYGSDVKPDFSKQPESSELKHKKKPEETPDANNEEPIPAPDAANNAPVDGPVTPATSGDANPTVNGIGNPDSPQNDPASGTGTTPPPTTREDIPPKTPRTDGKKPRDKTADNEMVQVEVCADSGMLATRYCPETIVRSYPKNKRPRRKCTLHKAPDEGGGIR